MITKSKTGQQILKRHPEIREELWGGKFWSSGKFVGTVGDGLSEEIVKKYILSQGENKEKENKRIEQLKLFKI
jgi:REP element-mobilizing transposase RayT